MGDVSIVDISLHIAVAVIFALCHGSDLRRGLSLVPVGDVNLLLHVHVSAGAAAVNDQTSRIVIESVSIDVFHVGETVRVVHAIAQLATSLVELPVVELLHSEAVESVTPIRVVLVGCDFAIAVVHAFIAVVARRRILEFSQSTVSAGRTEGVVVSGLHTGEVPTALGLVKTGKRHVIAQFDGAAREIGDFAQQIGLPRLVVTDCHGAFVPRGHIINVTIPVHIGQLDGVLAERAAVG